MAPSGIKNPFGKKTMTRKALCKLTELLDSAYNCVDHFEALEEKRGYDIGKQLPANLFKRGIESQLLEHWMSRGPSVHTLTSDGYNIEAGLAGCEWAAYLRVRNPRAVVLRVYPKNRAARAEHLLCQLISSLICNFATLAPAEFEKVSDLSKENFEILAQGGARGVGAGLGILQALPLLQLRGNGILCIVDALNIAEAGGAAHDVRQLKAVLVSILARNNGHLLYTMARTR
ncbi:hypothetical protein F5X97DRAFT_344358 [Nemania serpens]|nr:hypothetical protein F5X97DRAFT_344358 [Nemania serpens]